ncbi:MAG: alpha/beta hydrolase [Chloroflexi bacterium]|nr:alpha/beta hydrolase [Chloroflexota bacterium]
MTQGTPPEDKFVTVNGLRLHYLDWGGNADRVLLFAHGQGGNGHNFDHIAQELRDEFRILALDQRGHGDSDHTREGYSVKLFAADLAAFAEAVDIIPYDYCGASLGARNAIPYAGDHSDHLRHVVLLDYGPEMSTESARSQIGRIGTRPLGWRSKEDYIAYLRERDPRVSEEQLRRNAEYSLRLNYANRYVLKSDPDLFWINGSFGVAEVPYLWEQWAKIRCPILELKGALSNYLSPEILERMKRLQPTMRFAEVPDSGHPITSHNPAFLIEQLRQFLNEPASQGVE